MNIDLLLALAATNNLKDFQRALLNNAIAERERLVFEMEMEHAQGVPPIAQVQYDKMMSTLTSEITQLKTALAKI